MKAFLFRLSLFGVGLLLTALLADCLLTRGLHASQQGDYKVWNDLLKGKVASKVVIYGSSRAWVQVDPKIIEDSLGVSCYNLGMDGHNFLMQYYRHLLLFRYNPKPRLVVLILDYRTLDKRSDLYKAGQFLPYLDQDLLREATRQYKGFKTMDYYLPLVRYAGYKGVMRLSLDNLLHISHNSPDRYRGYAGQDRAWTGEFEKAKKEMKHYCQPLDTPSIRLFDRFLLEMQKAGISVLMVYPPEYVEGQAFVINREAIFSLYKNFSNKYNIPFLDFSSNKLCRQRKLFYNTQHLNKMGAELFTRLLVKDLRNVKGTAPLWKNE